MRQLLTYLGQYKKESILGPLFKLLEASFELLVPLVMAQVIDIGIRNGDVPYILQRGGLLILLGVVGLACSLTAQYFAAKAAVGFGTALRNDLFCHINRLSYAEVDQMGTSTLITRMTSDVNQVQSGVNLFLRLFLRSPFIVFGAMAMAFTVDVKAAMVFVVIIPILSAVVFGIMAISMPLYKKVQRQLDQVLGMVRENLAGVRVVRAFNRQEDEMEAFAGSNSRLVGLQVFVGKISALMNPVTYVIVNLGILALIWVGGGQVADGAITQGEVVALVNYMSQILVELIKLANLIVTISKSMACAGRVSVVFAVEPSIRPKPGDGHLAVTPKAAAGKGGHAHAPKVRFDQVEFCYAGAKGPSLSGISFEAWAGETIGIIGGTGSGKTTLVNLIPRFYDVSGGEVLVDGIDVREQPLGGLRGRIGVVPQRAVLFKGTLRDNMRWGKEDASDEEIFHALKMAQAWEFVEEKGKGLDKHPQEAGVAGDEPQAHGKPQGLEKPQAADRSRALGLAIQQGGKNLSGGQRQRLTIARALVRSPEILIMDDSASALDFSTDARLRRAIREGTKGMTVFIVSQRASTVRGADTILVLDDGRLVGKGTHEQLYEECQTYREICLSQLSEAELGKGREKEGGMR